MTARKVWYNDDKATPLAELRDRLGFADDDRAAFVDNLNVTMLLCDRLDAALNRIAALERKVDNYGEALDLQYNDIREIRGNSVEQIRQNIHDAITAAITEGGA